MEKFDPRPMVDYVAIHEISWVAFARRAGVPLATINGIIYDGAQPLAGTREKISAALEMDPPAPKLRHAAYVRLWWGRVDRATIALALGVSPQRVSAIAKRAGLPPLSRNSNPRKDEDHGERSRQAKEGRDNDAAAG